jgi:hypothetical protein
MVVGSADHIALEEGATTYMVRRLVRVELIPNDYGELQELADRCDERADELDRRYQLPSRAAGLRMYAEVVRNILR